MTMEMTMSANRRGISPADILPMDAYAKIRAERRRLIARAKTDRRVAVGPDATFYFESYATMLHQIHEMLFVEKGGAAQIADEIAAYDPLVPKGANLSATFMIEIEDPVRRLATLMRLGGIIFKFRMIVGFGSFPIGKIFWQQTPHPVHERE